MAKKGVCSICGVAAALTRDHVPPKSVMPLRAVEVQRLVDQMPGASTYRSSARPAEYSAEFASLCARCNNQLLGGSADPALVDLANAFSTWMRCAIDLGLSLPVHAVVTHRPTLVARAVFGHLLAADGARTGRTAMSSGSINTHMRRFLLSGDIHTPEELVLLVWPYAHDTTVVGKGIGHRDMSRPASFVMDVLKFRPIAFGVIDAADVSLVPPLAQIRTEGIMTADDTTDVHIPLRGIPDADWPEQPVPGGFVLSHKDRVMTVRPRRSQT